MSETNEFEKKLKALWECDHRHRKYNNACEIKSWGETKIDAKNLWVCKGVVDRFQEKEKENNKKDGKENEWSVWKKTAKTKEGKTYDEVIQEHNIRAEKSYYYYLSQKNKSVNGTIQPSGIGLKLFIDRDAKDGTIKTEYKYCKGKTEICLENDLKSYSETKDKINAIINDINTIRNTTDINGFLDVENKKNIPDSLRHKLMMVRVLEIYADEKISPKINLLFVDKGIADYYKKYIDQNEDKNKVNWVNQNIALAKRIAKIIGLGEDNLGYADMKKMSSLLWDYEHADELFNEINDDKCKQIIYTGAPGTGKTYGIRRYVEYLCMLDPIESEKSITGDDIKQHKFVQFHSTYDYSDFVEGLRPAKLNPKADDTTFVRMDGVFKSFCRDVVEYNKNHNNTKKFYFIIDEINRADLGKVFGELMFGLEESYRGEENPVDTQYRNLPTYYYNKNKNNFEKIEKDDCFKDGFYIPENVYIIGSMNDIDRSVETFDFALRRRFKWVNVGANDIMEKTLISMFNSSDLYAIDGSDDELFEKLLDNIINLNKVISGETDEEYNGSRFRLNEAYQIGPAYFKNFEGTEESLNNIWVEKVEPILREYVRGYEKEEINSFVKLCKEEFINDAIVKKLNGEEDNDSETDSNNDAETTESQEDKTNN